MKTSSNSNNHIIKESRDKFTVSLINDNENVLQNAFGDNQALDASKRELDKYLAILIDAQENIKRANESILAIKGKTVSDQKESTNKVSEVEEDDLKVESKDWNEINTNIGKVKVHPKGDVWEYMEGEYKGKQAFTQDAAIREALLLGKRLPDDNEWKQIILSINENINLNKGWQDDTSIRTKLGLELSGFRHTNGSFCYQGEFGYYWSSSKGCNVGFDSTQIYPIGSNNPSYGISTRCIKN